MRAVIFGGSGFIGAHLADSLLRDDIEVTLADVDRSEQSPEDAKYEYCDVREPIELAHETPYDLVFNLAAVHRTPGHEPHEYYDTNVRGALNVTDWCAAGGEQYLCLTSSIAVYGPAESPKTEDSDVQPESDYGRSKLIAEEIHRQWQRKVGGRRLRIVRPAAIFGPGERGNFTRLADALARHRFVYAGRRDVIKACGYVGDLVAALRYVEQLPHPELTFNFCYPRAYTIEEICETFHQVAGFALPHSLPKPALVAATAALSVMNPHDRGSVNAARVRKLTRSTNIEPRTLLQLGFEWPTELGDAFAAWRTSSQARFV